MGKFDVAAKILVAGVLLLGVSGCGAPEDTYRDFLELQASAVSAGLPCSGAESQTNESGKTGASCSDKSHILLAPGMTEDEIWEVKRDSTVLALGPLNEEFFAENEDQRSFVLIGPGFAVTTASDAQSQIEAMAKQGGTLKKVTLRHFYDRDTPWSKLKGAE